MRAVFDNGQTFLILYGLTQWDYGQKLLIEGLGVVKSPEIHFAAEGSTEAMIQPATAEGNIIAARIPDRLLELGSTIKAYVYVTDENSGETVRTITMPVNRRAKPEDYKEPEHQDLLRQILSTVEGKADDLSLTNGVLQLMSGDNPVGSRIRLPSGGSSGREVELRNNGTAIQWRYTDSNDWYDLIQMASLKGPPGITPEFEIREGKLFAIYNE